MNEAATTSSTGRDRAPPNDKLDPRYSSMDRATYKAERSVLQARLKAAVDKLGARSWAFVFEGRDTAGKTGTAEKMMDRMDEDRVSYVHHHAPTFADEKRAQRDMDYWKALMPKPGRVVFFDRSWYSSVLGLRVNSPGALDWKKQYAAINKLETEVALAGTCITKFFLEISRAEQFKRIQYRKTGPKEERAKFSPNDERALWQYNAYSKVIREALDKTGTPMAPWYFVEMGDKWKGRLRIMELSACLLEGDAPWPVQDGIERIPAL